MRKIIVTEFITLDGVSEAPGGNETPLYANCRLFLLQENELGFCSVTVK
jgi:hypothetical protein